MKKRGKRVSQFYPSGNSSGLAIVELSNWSGVCYKIPRPEVKNIGDGRKEVKYTGIYLLFGKGEGNNPEVYIGEAEDVHSRLSSHLSKKQFWDEVIIFVNSKNSLNKAYVKYLESRVYEEALKCGTYSLKNENKPTKSSLREHEEVEMEEFLDHAKFIIGTLGHDIFKPSAVEESVESTESDRQELNLEIKNSRGCRAEGVYLEGNKIKVKVGSTCSNTIKPSCPKGTLLLIDTLKKSGVLKDGTFKKSYEFNSPSAAASVITGGSASGNYEWKSESGERLGKILKLNN